MIKVDPDKCIGCQLCVSTCSKIFGFDDERNVAQAVGQEIGDCDIQDVIDSCPVGAISND